MLSFLASNAVMSHCLALVNQWGSVIALILQASLSDTCAYQLNCIEEVCVCVCARMSYEAMTQPIAMFEICTVRSSQGARRWIAAVLTHHHVLQHSTHTNP